jgi:transcription termination factor NusB
MEDVATLQTLINIGFSLFGMLLVIMLTALFKRNADLSNQIDKLLEKHNELAVEVPQQYVAKNDFRYMIDGLLSKLDKIETKLDKQIEKNTTPNA